MEATGNRREGCHKLGQVIRGNRDSAQLGSVYNQMKI